MKKILLTLFLCAALFLTGCSLLNREYSSVTPHSASYYESGNRSVLRAETYQDLVNDILVLVEGHTESGTIWFYADPASEDTDALVSQACQEVQQDTAMGSYALEYLSYTTTQQHGYVEIAATLEYRRSTEQLNDIVHITNLSALNSLLTTAAQEKRTELVIAVTYFDDQPQTVLDTVSAIQQEIAPEETEWHVNFYPANGTTGIVEILLKN